MPLLPIDLQILFSQMNQVGKEQAAQKDISPIHQSLQGAEIAEKTEHDDKSVNQSQEVGDGLEKVSDEKKKGEEKGASAKEQEEKQKELKKREIFKDPDLGQHIDISG